ncbi:MAG TPA: methyltransferase domain-containing protein [Allosphingosinicella sp.]|nr:methyltransferase domain-containing protein [Allosphingosinicella sp.]
MSFYVATLKRLIASGKLDPAAPTLVVAGGPYDRDCLVEAGFSEVTISNLDVRMKGDEFAPFAWSFQDAEALDFPDQSFDQVIEHAGLHHCGSPHRGLLEMYRVARKAVLVFENRDSLLMRAAVKLGLTHYYEIEAVADNDGEFGGVRNTAVPNYVYRWTEREVEKTIASNDPAGPVEVSFFYGMRLPTERLALHRSPVRKLASQMVTVPAILFAKLFPKQSNEFAFLVEKKKQYWPWIDRETGKLGTEWSSKKFKVAQK